MNTTLPFAMIKLIRILFKREMDDNHMKNIFSKFISSLVLSKSLDEKLDKEDFLLHILKNIVSEMKENHFENGHAGTLKITKEYLSNTEGYSFEEVKHSKLDIYYKGKFIGSIKGQNPSTNDSSALIISKDKIQTEKLLSAQNILTTKSILFDKDSYDFAKVYIESKNELMVVKPNALSGGRGISLDVTNENFDSAWKFAMDACIEQKKEVEILIQKYVEGVESRFLVIDNKFESAILRVPANVIGDGVHTIDELINIKNKDRFKNPYLKRLLIKKDDCTNLILLSQGKDLNTVTKYGEVSFIRRSSNLTQGGDNIEISHLVSEHMKRLSEESVRAIPGLNTAGVDILYKSFKDEEPLVLEINPAANLRMHHYPWKGEPKTPVYTLIESMRK